MELLLSFVDLGFEGDTEFAEKIIQGINFNKVFAKKAELFNKFVIKFQKDENMGTKGKQDSKAITVRDYARLYKNSAKFAQSIVFKMSIKLILLLLRINDKGLSPFALRYVERQLQKLKQFGLTSVKDSVEGDMNYEDEGVTLQFKELNTFERKEEALNNLNHDFLLFMSKVIKKVEISLPQKSLSSKARANKLTYFLVQP